MIPAPFCYKASDFYISILNYLTGSICYFISQKNGSSFSFKKANSFLSTNMCCLRDKEGSNIKRATVSNFMAF